MRELVKSGLSEVKRKVHHSGRRPLPNDAFELVTDILAELVLEDLQQRSRISFDVDNRVGRMEESSPYPHQGHA